MTYETPVGANMFAYCGNNPIKNKDPNGDVWETAFDIVSFGYSIADVATNPYDAWAWACLAGDFLDVAIPFVGGIGETTRAAKALSKADELLDTAADAVKIHGNSLNTTKKTVGYALVKNDTLEVMKYGETTRGTKRYTKKFYEENNVHMEIMETGSKREMHMWQHYKILDYKEKYGKRPIWNKSDW